MVATTVTAKATNTKTPVTVRGMINICDARISSVVFDNAAWVEYELSYEIEIMLVHENIVNISLQ